jgi:hypothetical protein
MARKHVDPIVAWALEEISDLEALNEVGKQLNALILADPKDPRIPYIHEVVLTIANQACYNTPQQRKVKA